MYKLILILIVTILTITGCEKDPSSVADQEKEVKLNGAFILNEGNFGQANASVSYYSFDDKSIQNEIFKSVNNRGLGDVAQSMTIVDTLGFIVVNNSNMVEVISTNTWKSLATIPMPAGFSPRSMAYDDNGFGYITNLFGNNVSVINLANYEVEVNIPVGSNPDEIVIVDQTAYVANSGFGYGNTVSVIDLVGRTVTKEITVADNPGYLTVDAENEIHVLCTGRWPAWGDTTDKGTDGGLYVIDPVNNDVVDSFTISGHPSELAYGGGNTAYFISGAAIAEYSTDTHKVTNENFIAGFFYAVEADPVSGLIFVLDAKDYTQSGELKIYNDQAQLQESHPVGIIPGAITFNYGLE